MDTLFLTAKEKTIFAALPSNVTQGCEVVLESRVYSDTKEKFMVRISLMNLRDPKLLAVQEKVKTIQSVEEILPYVEKLQLADIAESDLLELFFAMGPHLLSVNIVDLLQKASVPEDMAAVAALSFIRQSVLTSLLSASSQWSARN